MIKADRKKLRCLMQALMNSIDGRHPFEGLFDRETVDTAGNGRVSLHFFYPETHRDRFWLACRLLDWPESVHYPNRWHGFDHWKQNLHPPEVSPEVMVEYVRQHLVMLGVESAKLVKGETT